MIRRGILTAIACDHPGCVNEYIGVGGAVHLRTQAHGLGWRHRFGPGGGDRCPKHPFPLRKQAPRRDEEK